MGRKLAKSLHSEGCDQCFQLRVATCCKWGLPEIAIGFHTVHLHKDLGDGFESTFTRLLIPLNSVVRTTLPVRKNGRSYILSPWRREGLEAGG